MNNHVSQYFDSNQNQHSDKVGDGIDQRLQKLQNASDKGIQGMVFAANALLNNFKTQPSPDKQEQNLNLKSRNQGRNFFQGVVQSNMQTTIGSTLLGSQNANYSQLKPISSPTLLMNDDQEYTQQKNKIEFPEDELSDMPKDKRIYYRFIQKHQRDELMRQKSFEQRQKQRMTHTNNSPQMSKRYGAGLDSSFNSVSRQITGIVGRKNSKLSTSTFVLDDFGGDARALKQAQSYKNRLSNQVQQQLKTFETREKLKHYSYIVLTIFLNVLNLMACIIFIVEDYLSFYDCEQIPSTDPNQVQVVQNTDPNAISNTSNCTVPGSTALDNLEVSISLVFLLEFMYNFQQQAKPRYQFFFKKETYVDVLTIAPPLLNLILENKIKIGFLRMLRMLKIMRIARIFKLLKQGDGKQQKNDDSQAKPSFQLSPIQNQVIILMLNIFTTIFIAAGVIMFIDNVSPNSFYESMSFVDAFYYMIITSGTIGYGDIYPITATSRMTIIVIIVMIISVFGNQISELAAIIKEADFYDTQYNMKNHIIVLGTQKVSLVTKFLLNFYSDQMSNPNPPQCIIVGETKISPKMKRILNFTLFEERVHYLSVKSIDQQALQKGCFFKAQAIFYLSEQFSENPDACDKKALFINQFLINNNIRCNMYIQLCMTDQQSFMRMRKIDDKWQDKDDTQTALQDIQNIQSQNAKKQSRDRLSTFNSSRISTLSRINQMQQTMNQKFVKNQMQNVIYINLVKTKFQILAFSLFNEGVLQLYSNWFLFNHELLNENSIKRDQQVKFKQLVDTASIYQQQLDYKLHILDFPICFIGKTFLQALRIINNINHNYRGRYIVKSILIGMKKSHQRQPSYSKKGQILPLNCTITQRQLSNDNKLNQEYPSVWHLNQDIPQFSSDSKSYIINSPDSTIQYGDQALLLASCDDVLRFFTDKNANEILQYEHQSSIDNFQKRELLPGFLNSLHQNIGQHLLRKLQGKKNSQNQTHKVHPDLDQMEDFTAQDNPFLNTLKVQNSKVIQTHFDTQASHRQLIPNNEKHSSQNNMNLFENSNNYFFKNGSNQSTIYPTISDYGSTYQGTQQIKNSSQSTLLRSKTIKANKNDQQYSDLTQIMGESLSLSSTSQEFNDSSSNSDDEEQFFPDEQNTLAGNGFINLSKKIQSEMRYKKVLQDKNLKLDVFMLRCLQTQLNKLFDYRCSLNQQGKIVDLSQTSVNKQIGNHIVIYGGQKQGMDFFIEEIRRISDVPLCLFSQSEEMEEQFLRMTAKFNNIFYFKGDILNLRHVRNANLKQAQVVVVLSKKSDENPFGDSQSLIVTQFIRGLYPQKKIITEIMDITRLPLLEQPIQEEIKNTPNLNHSYFLSKELMSGRILFSQQIEKLAMLRSTEPHLTNVFLKMIGQEFQILDQNEDETFEPTNKNQGEKAGQHKENSSLMSLRIPHFMDGHDYWQLFDEMAEVKGFIFLGIYTRNFNVKEQSDTLNLFSELKGKFDQMLQEDDNNTRRNKKSQANRRKSKFFIGKGQGVGFAETDSPKKNARQNLPSEDDWFNLDVSPISDSLPLLILNPPMGTKLKAGDSILALGKVSEDFIIRHLTEKKSKMSKSNQSTKKLSLLLRRQHTLIDNEILKSLVDEFVIRVDNLQENIETIKSSNKELSSSIQAYVNELEGQYQ